MKYINKNIHSFHLVDPSPWPLVCAVAALSITFGTVLHMHGYEGGRYLYKLGFVTMINLGMQSWWMDIIREVLDEGQHTLTVQKGLRMGMLLFIVSEIMFFFAFFWAFFHVSFNPSLAIGGVWPPVFITTLDPWKIPLLNTFLLLSSGAAVTWSHHSISFGNKSEACISLIITIILAVIFTLLQRYEYASAPFTISDSVYGSTFYMATGFHGFHVIIGTFFLVIAYIRLFENEFTKTHHFNFEAAAWYWHFVDVVWLFLFLTIYWWGS